MSDGCTSGHDRLKQFWLWHGGDSRCVLADRAGAPPYGVSEPPITSVMTTATRTIVRNPASPLLTCHYGATRKGSPG